MSRDLSVVSWLDEGRMEFEDQLAIRFTDPAAIFFSGPDEARSRASPIIINLIPMDQIQIGGRKC